jgi:hypothetical protein
VVLVGRQLLEIHLVVGVAVIRQENKFSLLSGRSNEKCYRESNSPDSVFLKVMNIKKLKITFFKIFLWQKSHFLKFLCDFRVE